MSGARPGNTAQTGPTVAVVINSMAPYRFYQCLAIVKALRGAGSDLQLLTPILCEHNNIAWPMPPLDGFGGVVLGPGETVPDEPTLGSWVRGVGKGRRLLGLLNQRDVRAVVISGYMFSEFWMVLLWARAKGIPAFLVGDSNISGDEELGVLKRAFKRLIVGGFIRSCHGVMPVGSQGEKYFARYGATPERTFVVTFEVDPDLARPMTPDERAGHRAWTGFTDGRRRILCSGRLRSFKRFHDALQAFLAIADQRPQWDLVFAGDGPERRSLEQAVPAHLRSRVKFLGLITDPARVVSLFKDTHVFLHPAGYEPWGMVIQEAAAAGLPTIATTVTGAAADLVHDDDNGFRVNVGDVRAMTGALLTLTDDEHYPRFARNARTKLARWHERYEAGRGFVAAMRSAGVC